MDGTFAACGYDVLVRPWSSTLPAGAHRAIVAFAAAGGHVIADPHLQAEIPNVTRIGANFDPWRTCNYASVSRGGPDRDAVKADLDAFIARFRTIHDAGVPQPVAVAIPAAADEVVWYDLIEHREVARRGADGMARIERLLPPAGGVYLAAYPEPITELAIVTARSRAKTDPVTVSLALRGASGKPVPGLQPVRVRIYDANGVETEYSR